MDLGPPLPSPARFYINPTLSNQGFHEKGQRTSFAPIKKTSPLVALSSHEYKTAPASVLAIQKNSFDSEILPAKNNQEKSSATTRL